MEYATGADGLETKYDGNNETSEDVGAADDLDSYGASFPNVFLPPKYSI